MLSSSQLQIHEIRAASVLRISQTDVEVRKHLHVTQENTGRRKCRFQLSQMNWVTEKVTTCKASQSKSLRHRRGFLVELQGPVNANEIAVPFSFHTQCWYLKAPPLERPALLAAQCPQEKRTALRNHSV